MANTLLIRTRNYLNRQTQHVIEARCSDGRKRLHVCGPTQNGQLPKFPEHEIAARALAVELVAGSDVQLIGGGNGYTFAVVVP